MWVWCGEEKIGLEERDKSGAPREAYLEGEK